MSDRSILFQKYDVGNPSTGTYEVKVNWTGDEEYTGAESGLVGTLTVTPKPTDWLPIGGIIVALIIVCVAFLFFRKATSLKELKKVKRQLEGRAPRPKS